MIIGKNHCDHCLVIETERPCTCASCGAVVPTGARAWSYLSNPTHGNYAECFNCRYGDAPTNWQPIELPRSYATRESDQMKTIAQDCAAQFDIGALDQIGRAARSFADTVRRYAPEDCESADKFAALGVAIANVIALAEQGK